MLLFKAIDKRALGSLLCSSYSLVLKSKEMHFDAAGPFETRQARFISKICAFDQVFSVW